MGLKVEKRYGQAGWRVRDNGKHVPKEAWPFGLRSEMSLEEARGYIKSLNARKRIVRDEEKKRGALGRRLLRLRVECAFLPESVVTEFEALYLQGERSKRAQAKLESCWRAAQTVIAEAGIDPLLWHKVPDRIYSHFIKRAYGADWVQRQIRMLNDYGELYGDYRGKTFRKLKVPTGTAHTKLLTAFHARLPRGLKSKPLTKHDLLALKSKLTPAQYGWIWVCFWFGLRPEECDQLCTPGRTKWRIEVQDNVQVLVIYQPKLRAVMPEARYKRIPALLPEQLQAIELLAGMLSRPSRRAVARFFPEGVTLYGARHGFTLLQDNLGVDLRTISQWLGHRELSTTQKYYQDLSILRLPKAG